MRAWADAKHLLATSRTIVTFNGAGLSAESGIATFRDAETNSLWKRFDPMELASPEGFARNPKLVIDWYNWRRQTVANAKPNPAHYTLAQQSTLFHISQNVDDLLQRAGCEESNLIQLHGSLTKDRCHNPECGYQETIAMNNPPPLRHCPICNHYLRPAVVWFGETLPQDAWKKAETQVLNADLLVVIGTSATVYPAASLIHLAQAHGAKILVLNNQPNLDSSISAIEICAPCGESLPQLFPGN